VIKAPADGKIEDTGPMTRKRMETADEEFLAGGLPFMDASVKAKKPFFMWFNSTRMHVWTHLKPESDGVTGIGLYPDGMAEHDLMVGQLLNKLDELGVADNTIVVYSTDNGAETISWPDGGTTPFHGEKGTTWEGGFRVPMMIRWPGTVKPATKSAEIISQEDWMPTLLAAAGVPDIVGKLKQGHTANGKSWKVHLDGYDMGPYFRGETKKGPRDAIYYFAATGDLNAVRVNDFKAHFAIQSGGINTAVRHEPAWPLVVNLKADPYEKAALDSEMYLDWYAKNTMWTFVPIQRKVQQFLSSLQGYPFQQGSSLSAAGINYRSLKAMAVLKELEKSGIPVGR
jgi:arylsulfatase